MKAIRKLSKTLVVVAVLCLVGSLLMGAYNPQKWRDANAAILLAQGIDINVAPTVIEIDGLTQIDISIKGSGVSIRTDSVTVPTLSYKQTYDNQFEVSTEDGKLVVKQNKFKNKIFGWDTTFSLWYTSEKLALLLPSGFVADSITADVDSGMLEIINVNTAGELNIQGTSGGILLDHVKAQSIEVEHSSGSVRLEDVEATSSIKVAAQSGSITVTDVEAASLSATVASGSLTVRDVEVTGAVSLKSSSGSITVTDVSAYTINASADSGSVRINDSEAKAMTIDAKSGTVRITLPEEEQGKYVYRCNVTSGSIRYNGDSYKSLNTSTGAADERLITVIATSGTIRIMYD